MQTLQKKSAHLQLGLQGKIGIIIEVINGREGKILGGVRWRLIGASIVFNKEGFETSGGQLVHELAHQQHRDHGIFKNWARFERKAGKASIGKYWRAGDNTMFRSIEDVRDWVDKLKIK